MTVDSSTHLIHSFTHSLTHHSLITHHSSLTHALTHYLLLMMIAARGRLGLGRGLGARALAATGTAPSRSLSRVSECGSDVDPVSNNDEIQIQRMYQEYTAAFTAGDMRAVATHYLKAPVCVSLCVRSTRVMRSVFLTPLDVQQALTFQMEGLTARGYAGRSDMQPLTFTPMTDMAKMIHTEGIRYHTSGEVLEKIRASYVVERFDEEAAEESSSHSHTHSQTHSHSHSPAGRWFVTSVHAEIIPVMEF